MKILFTGMGSIGQRHARNLRALYGEHVELCAYRARGLNHVITPSLEIKEGATIETEYQITEYRDWSEALDARPVAVFVTNPNHLHMKFALDAAEAGCHLFIEKPLSHSLEGINELKARVSRKHLVAFVGYQLRFHPGFVKLQGLLKENAIGRVTSVHHNFGEYLPNWHKYEDYRGYHAARAEQGGGVLLSQIHDLDFLYGLFGMPEKVFAMGGRRGDLSIDVEDTVDLLMKMNFSGYPIAVHLHQDFLQDPPSRRSELIGTTGKIVWDYYGCKLEWFRLGEKNPTVFEFESFDRNQLFRDELVHFFNCIETGCKPAVTLDDAEASLKMAWAAKRSLENEIAVKP